MKKIIYSLSFIALLSTSCKDSVLDFNAEDTVLSTRFFQTQNDAISATNQIYGNLRSWPVAAFAPLGLLNITSDDAEKGSDPGDASFMDDLNNFTYTSTAGQIQDYWGGQFAGINLCNQVITNVPKITMDESLKARLIAEARFFRAYHYFNLVRCFGGVPIFDGLPADGNYNKPRNTVAEVYTFIQADFNAAASVLPQSYASTEVGRATKGAALSFLAKTYLYQKNWAQVKTLTEQVMTMGYDLFPDYYQMFRIANENCIESILEVQCGGDPDNSVLNDCQYGEVQGVRNQWGWGFGTPTQNLYDAFENGDVRREATILVRGTTTLEGDLIASTAPNLYYNAKVYVPSAQQVNKGSWNSNQNIRLMRYAEILLMNAEANNELGNTAPAIADINKIRTRAHLANTTATTQADLRTAIRKERRVELALEWDRFLDLVRIDEAKNVLANFTDKNKLFPIPDAQIVLSKGVLTQNPGY